MRVAVIQPDSWDISARGHAAFHPLILKAHAEGADAVFTPDGLVGVLQGTARLIDDECFDVEHLARLDGHAFVLVPRAESELQAEAVIEFAVALTESVCGVVVILEPAEVGGSAIVVLGEVVAEAGIGEQLIAAEVPIPLPLPHPPAPLPDLPPILAQRLSVHRGEKPEPGYPADLS